MLPVPEGVIASHVANLVRQAMASPHNISQIQIDDAEARLEKYREHPVAATYFVNKKQVPQAAEKD